MDSAEAWDPHSEPSLTEVLDYKGGGWDVGGGNLSESKKPIFSAKQENNQCNFFIAIILSK